MTTQSTDPENYTPNPDRTPTPPPRLPKDDAENVHPCNHTDTPHTRINNSNHIDTPHARVFIAKILD